MSFLSSQANSAVDLCCYVNATRHIQVARIIDVKNWYFEQVVFPGERLLFEAPRNAHLEIHSGATMSAILTDTIACQSLRVKTSTAIAP